MRIALLILAAAMVVLIASPARAEIVQVNLTTIDGQDSPALPGNKEMGVNFPADEMLSSSSTTVTYTPCSEPGNYDDPNIPNIEVFVTNLTELAYRDVWYVADTSPEHRCTTLSNYDNWLVNQGLAFHIDTAGYNQPLVYESLLQDGIWQAGETWGFVIQDYQNVEGLAADLLGSVGVGLASAHGPDSSGSILVPEPASLLLLCLGAGAILRRRR